LQLKISLMKISKKSKEEKVKKRKEEKVLKK
jgi:hypothetical protein